MAVRDIGLVIPSFVWVALARCYFDMAKVSVGMLLHVPWLVGGIGLKFSGSYFHHEAAVKPLLTLIFFVMAHAEHCAMPCKVKRCTKCAQDPCSITVNCFTSSSDSDFMASAPSTPRLTAAPAASTANPMEISPTYSPVESVPAPQQVDSSDESVWSD
eukprot:5827168-Amphidinium_carterae.1